MLLWDFEGHRELLESAWFVFRHRHITFDDRIANRTGEDRSVIEMALRVPAVTDESCPLEDQSPQNGRQAQTGWYPVNFDRAVHGFPQCRCGTWDLEDRGPFQLQIGSAHV